MVRHIMDTGQMSKFKFLPMLQWYNSMLTLQQFILSQPELWVTDRSTRAFSGSSSTCNGKSFIPLSHRSHSDIWQYLMVDIVVNHMVWDGNASDVQYNTMHPFNTSSYYHPYCDPSDNVTVVRTSLSLR